MEKIKLLESVADGIDIATLNCVAFVAVCVAGEDKERATALTPALTSIEACREFKMIFEKENKGEAGVVCICRLEVVESYL